MVFLLSIAGCSHSDNSNAKYRYLLQPLSLYKKIITVSGFSSGGYMAHQYHIAFSDQVVGAAMFASGPYGCAENSLNTAFENCLNSQHTMDVNKLAKSLREAAEKRKVSAISNLHNDRAWVYHGADDPTVSRQVASSLFHFYQALSVSPDLEFNISSGHSFPTENFGSKCELTKAPYLNNCNFDGAGAAFIHLYENLKPKTDVAEKY
ncbi:MAG: putative esterase [Lentisphaeria bacterium]|jgi:predicted esterase